MQKDKGLYCSQPFKRQVHSQQCVECLVRLTGEAIITDVDSEFGCTNSASSFQEWLGEELNTHPIHSRVNLTASLTQREERRSVLVTVTCPVIC